MELSNPLPHIVGMRRFSHTALLLASGLLLLPLFGFGACQAYYDEDPAPDVEGSWDITYDDLIGVEITLGGAVYTAELGVQGGTVTIDHEGEPITFELDCADENIVCPSEVWPEQVAFEQREVEYPHRVWMPLPTQTCDGEMAPALPEECGEETLNPECEDVCEGEMVADTEDRFGLISEDATEMAVVLGGGAATNGVNCALLGLSLASADLVSTGSTETGDWTGTHLSEGEVAVGYAGGCLWADDVDGDSELEAVVLSASVVFTTGFEGVRTPDETPM
jgi:hypothetical protein